MIVISDTSAITNLAAIEYLPLLPQLYTQVQESQAIAKIVVSRNIKVFLINRDFGYILMLTKFL